MIKTLKHKKNKILKFNGGGLMKHHLGVRMTSVRDPGKKSPVLFQTNFFVYSISGFVAKN
ncbi:MAG: hypothetical protein LEGION0403_FIIPPAGN_02512 [Legionella sp.]